MSEQDFRLEIPEQERKAYLMLALESLVTTRKIILGYWSNSSFDVQSKDDASPVTQADLESEVAFRELISKRHPTHGIIGEEFPSVNPESEFQWTIDPVDGTQNFAFGIPTFGTMLSLRFRNKPIVGLIDHPALGRLVHSGYGLGTYFNDSKVRISDVTQSSLAPDTIVLTSTRAMFERTGEGHLLDSFMKRHQVTRIYYDCFGHSLVAGGHAPVAVEFNVRIWDSSPTELMVQEAGGAFEYVREHPDTGKRNFLSAIFGKPRLVELLKEQFNS